MKIIDIAPEHENQYFCCLEDWSQDMKEAGDAKKNWYEYMKDKGVRVKLAQDDNGTICGMIQYVPIQHSMYEGNNLYVVLCIWVHGHKQGIGDYRKRGIGTQLLKAAEEDCKNLGVDGIVTWGLLIPVFMRSSWFKRHGYQVVDKNGMMRLLWKPFNDQAIPPKFIKPKKKPLKGENVVNVSIFRNGWCPAFNTTAERTVKASKEFIGKINLIEYNTTDRNIVDDWGIHSSLFIDNKEVWTGPPIPYEKIRRRIEKRARKI